MATIGNRSYKAFWDSGAVKYVLSVDCYQSILPNSKQNYMKAASKSEQPMVLLLRTEGSAVKIIKTFKINNEQFAFPFLCSDQLSQQFILGHNFARAFHIGTSWDTKYTMSLTINGRTFAETTPANDIQALVFYFEGAIVQPYSNGYIPCRLHTLLTNSNPGRNFVFEPSYKHRPNYSHCDTYDGLVKLYGTIVKTGIFNIVMTNRSNRHIKINKGQTIGMLRTCEEEQICTIHKMPTFHSSKIGITPRNQHNNNGKECSSFIKEKTQKLYHIYTWNAKTGKVEVNTLITIN